MEVGPGIGEANRRTIAPAVRQDEDVRIVRVMELVDHVGLGLAEAAREVDILVRRQLLVAKHQHLAA